MSSQVSGSLDTSSTINAKSANLKMYNINIENTHGKGAQVRIISLPFSPTVFTKSL